MIPSYIQEIPNGTEKGTFLALDLGGTNLRVCEVTLLGESKWTMKQQKYKVSDSLKMGDVSQLFDYIAGSVDHFLTEIGTDASEDEKLHLGFTFSFPVLQTALAAGTLINWTKVSFTKSSRMSPFLERRIQIVYVFSTGFRMHERDRTRYRSTSSRRSRPQAHPRPLLGSRQRYLWNFDGCSLRARRLPLWRYLRNGNERCLC